MEHVRSPDPCMGISDMDVEKGGKQMELSIKGLTKQFKDKTAVDHVDLTITPGVWGLLGANGAGRLR